MKKGDWESGFKESDHIIEGEMRVGGQEHFYFETQTALCVPKPESGEIDVFTSSQDPRGTQSNIARVLGVNHSRVNVRVKRVGGGFGGKETK